VEVWALNTDAGPEWLLPYRQEKGLTLPLLYQPGEILDNYKLGRRWREFPPLYMVIDKQGVVRHRSWGQGSITGEQVRALMETLLMEGGDRLPHCYR